MGVQFVRAPIDKRVPHGKFSDYSRADKEEKSGRTLCEVVCATRRHDERVISVITNTEMRETQRHKNANAHRGREPAIIVIDRRTRPRPLATGTTSTPALRKTVFSAQHRSIFSFAARP